MKKLALVSLLAPALLTLASPHDYDDDWYEYHYPRYWKRHYPSYRYGAYPEYYVERDLRAILQNKEAMKKVLQNNPDLKKELMELLKQ